MSGDEGDQCSTEATPAEAADVASTDTYEGSMTEDEWEDEVPMTPAAKKMKVMMDSHFEAAPYHSMKEYMKAQTLWKMV